MLPPLQTMAGAAVQGTRVPTEMSARVRAEIEAGLLSVVKDPCVCVHPLGAVPKRHDDFRAIVDCSTPTGFCVNEHTDQCRTKLYDKRTCYAHNYNKEGCTVSVCD